MFSRFIESNLPLQKIVFLFFALLLLFGCAAHPTISPIPLKPGESYTGVTFSIENVFPVFVYRRGLTDITDIGFRIGLPIYGTGIDYSRVVFQRGNFYDVLNFAFSWTPNSNIDMTYYTVRTFPKKPGNAIYSGFRGMYIPRGISGSESFRIGLLVGLRIEKKWGIEIGYFHDFDRGQPLEELFNMDPKNDQRYLAVTDFGFPSEHSRLVGLSLQFSLYIPKSLREQRSK